MPRYAFNLWEESKWTVSFNADNLEHAKELLLEAQEETSVEELPDVERYFRKGDEFCDTESLQEMKEDNNGNE
jgi:hypothetical protein